MCIVWNLGLDESMYIPYEVHTADDAAVPVDGVQLGACGSERLACAGVDELGLRMGARLK